MHRIMRTAGAVRDVPGLDMTDHTAPKAAAGLAPQVPAGSRAEPRARPPAGSAWSRWSSSRSRCRRNALRPPGALAENGFPSRPAIAAACACAPAPTIRSSSPELGCRAGHRHAVFPGARRSRARCARTFRASRPARPARSTMRSPISTRPRWASRCWSSRETCLNFLGLRCDVCYRVCPVIDKAITLEERHNQRTGRHAIMRADGACGALHRLRQVRDAPACWRRRRSRCCRSRSPRGKLGEHYRLGWEEKKRQGGALVPDLIELPKRMPGAAP